MPETPPETAWVKGQGRLILGGTINSTAQRTKHGHANGGRDLKGQGRLISIWSIPVKKLAL